MKKDYYMHQRFLLNCDYESIDIANYSAAAIDLCAIKDFHEERTLFDDAILERRVFASYLDTYIDNERDWNEMLDMLQQIGVLYIVDDRLKSDNSIITSMAEATMKAYIYRLIQARIKTVICEGY